MKIFYPIKFLSPLVVAAWLVLAVMTTADAQTGIASADRELRQWRNFSPPEGRFTVSLPAQPEGAIIPVETQGTTLELHGFMSKTTASTYLVAYLDYLKMPDNAEDMDRAFDAGRERMLNSNKSATLLSESKISIGNFPAREFVYQIEGNLFKTKMIIVRNRGYLLQIATPILRNLPKVIVEVYQAEADKFFNSFEILDNKKK